jgi:hypothetical protein
MSQFDSPSRLGEVHCMNKKCVLFLSDHKSRGLMSLTHYGPIKPALLSDVPCEPDTGRTQRYRRAEVLAKTATRPNG